MRNLIWFLAGAIALTRDRRWRGPYFLEDARERIQCSRRALCPGNNGRPNCEEHGAPIRCTGEAESGSQLE